ncbi:MAG TPA: hypothetical protein VK324_15490 [Tepidisphaeraceae bacterium]|nr:hypothetical protein [Tepidisphaeraceae bacterium]
MTVRFYVDLDSDLPHIDRHGVAPDEVLDVLRGRSDHGPGRDGTRVAEGQTRAGRYLRVIFRENEVEGSILVITAYALTGKAKASFRRRRRS